MNRINPIYIFILLLMVLSFASFKLMQAKDELKESKKDYAEVEMVSSSLVSLKDMYANKANIKKSLQKILTKAKKSTPTLKYKFKNKSVKISSSAIGLKSLNSLMSSILNKTYEIKSFSVKKSSDKVAELKMEIKW